MTEPVIVPGVECPVCGDPGPHAEVAASEELERLLCAACETVFDVHTEREGTAMTIDRFAAPCPHPDCRHRIKIRADLLADTYLCPCHAITVRLAWDSYVGGPRQPRLSRQETR